MEFGGAWGAGKEKSPRILILAAHGELLEPLPQPKEQDPDQLCRWVSNQPFQGVGVASALQEEFWVQAPWPGLMFILIFHCL